ncbi:hypothetical protein TNCT_28521, partial [Trichonephila clavata]
IEYRASDCNCKQSKPLLPPGFQPLLVSPVPKELWIVPASAKRTEERTQKRRKRMQHLKDILGIMMLKPKEKEL